ncbi:MAG: YfhO family protein, partial [Flavobacteriales bacterium]|nr:YfhO family protein [Flavobacteriales bacterium]
IKNYLGASKEIIDFREATGNEALWTNSMFSGMPAYQISIKFKKNLIKYVDKLITLGLPRPINLLFLYLLGFYILLLTLKVDYRIAFFGAIAFAFSSYFFIIIQAGHMSKAHSIGYFSLVVASVIYTYNGKKFLGASLTALTVALQVYTNHFQITYYLVLLLMIYGFLQFVKDYYLGNLSEFFKRSSLLILAAILAAGTSYTRLKATSDYGKESTRGKSELTTDIENKTTGLDKDYATQWSYGISESMTLLIPNFHGGSSGNSVLSLEDSETLDFLRKFKNKKVANALAQFKSSSYWGEQPIVSGPTYVGSIILFLFVLGLFIIKSNFRTWILLSTAMSIMLAWGKNFMPLTEFFLEYFPAYNKFRAVSMILVVAEFTIPLFAIIALNKFLTLDSHNKNNENFLKYSFYIVGGISLLFALFPTLFLDFLSEKDMIPISNSVKTPNGFLDSIVSDRSSLLISDAWRSFLFILISFGILMMFIKQKLKKQYVIILIGLLIVSDMWNVNKRYLNDDNFVRKNKMKNPFIPTQADNFILSDNDPNFRVFNQSVSTFNDASTSYFHKSIGGYHGAKLKRYQELIENHISKGNMSVLNMLNTKYFISSRKEVQINQSALGNCWFVSNVNIVENADQEISSLGNFNPSKTAIVDSRFTKQINDSLFLKEGSSIVLTDYKPNHLTYSANAVNNSIAIFSEIYYDKGWNAYLDGKITSHFRANYVLRGMNVPSGKHIIEFKFEPQSYKTGEVIAMSSSIILLLLLFLISFRELQYR